MISRTDERFVHNSQQRNVFLLVDEVRIRPTVAFSGGVLNDMAKMNWTQKQQCKHSYHDTHKDNSFGDEMKDEYILLSSFCIKHL